MDKRGYVTERDVEEKVDELEDRISTLESSKSTLTSEYRGMDERDLYYLRLSIDKRIADLDRLRNAWCEKGKDPREVKTQTENTGC